MVGASPGWLAGVSRWMVLAPQHAVNKRNVRGPSCWVLVAFPLRRSVFSTMDSVASSPSLERYLDGSEFPRDSLRHMVS